MKFKTRLPNLKKNTAVVAFVMSLVLLSAIGISTVDWNAALSDSSGQALRIGAIEEADPGAPSTGARGTFKKIVIAPVRLFAKLFRSNNSSAAIARKNSNPVAAGTENDAASVASAIEREAASIFDQSVELHDKKQLEAAIAKLTVVVAMQPNHSEAYNLLGVCYDETGKYQEAQREYKKAIQVEAVNSRFLNNLGYSYYLAENDKQAIKYYQRALKLTPDDKRLLNNLGLAFGRKGEFGKAREQFARAVGEVGAYLNMGFIYSQHGQYQRAIDQFEAALKLEPNSMVALSNLAQVYDRVGRVRDSQMLSAQYKKLAEPGPRSSQTAERKTDPQDKDDQ